MDERRWRSWRDAMQDALYGDNGFYRSSGAPGRHFRTAAHTSPLWAEALAELAHRVDRSLGEPDGFTVVDVGAGGGELLRALSATAPERWRLVGVDVAGRPPGLPRRVEWSAEPPARSTGVVVAVEWLDVVPVDVIEQTDAGLRAIEVADDGEERLAGPAGDDDVKWLTRWWPLVEPGDRAEVGRSRDDAWAGLVTHALAAGVALAVDYAAEPARDVAGTMTGYRDGRQVVPVPDGSCDITAHVLMASCADAVADAETRLTSQCEALRALGVSGERPAYDGNVQGYVAALSQASAAAELLDPQGLGGFTWLLHARGCPLPLPPGAE